MIEKTTPMLATQKWLLDVVIGHNFCPFAKREFDGGRIHYSVIEGLDLEAQLERVLAECAALDDDANRETSLLIFPDTLADFDDYLDMLSIATDLLTAQGYDGIYQLASFHPDYQFEGAGSDNVGPDDASHYTNRSPYPMLHILREASVTAAVERHPNAEGIPARNIEHARELGVPVLKALLVDCFGPSAPR